MHLPHPESFVLQSVYDLVIVGSGGASMCAALAAKEAGLSPVIVEKQERIGGSTAFSGGVWWVPNNAVMRRTGVDDSADLAWRYFESVVDASKGSSSARRWAFIEKAPHMVDFLERQGMKFQYADGWADYYDERPGGHSRGRSLVAEPMDLNRLGPWKEKLAYYEPYRYMPIGAYELMQMVMFMRSWKARKILLRFIAAVIGNKIMGRDVVGSGCAVQSRMLEMTLKHSIPIITGFATDRLIEQNCRIVGVEGAYKGKRTAIHARNGVLLDTGGFARNEEMRQRYQRKPISAQWTNANPGDTGEMLLEAMRIGAAAENLDTAIWILTSLNPDLSMPAGAVAKDGRLYPFMHNSDISTPHIIMVNKAGRRYINEAQSYMELGEAMYQHEAVPTFAVFDQRHMKRYVWGSMPPGRKPVQKWIETGYLVKADTIDELAHKAGIDPTGLTAQVERFNRFSQHGVDEEFHKGDRAYDRFRGDPTVKPNPCLGEISKPPFYAVRMYPADVGTFGGLVTDNYARVLREDGSIIPGLYAAGNCTSSVMGRTYPGAGASISASFTFGYIAANDAAGRKTHPSVVTRPGNLDKTGATAH